MLGLSFYKVAEDIRHDCDHHFGGRQLFAQILMRAHQYAVPCLVNKVDPGGQRQLTLLVHQHYFDWLESVIEFSPVVKSFRIHETRKEQCAYYWSVGSRLIVCYLMTDGTAGHKIKGYPNYRLNQGNICPVVRNCQNHDNNNNSNDLFHYTTIN